MAGKTDRVLWLNSFPMFATHIGFAPSKAAWDRQMKALGITGSKYPQTPGMASRFRDEASGKTILLLTIQDGCETKHSAREIQATILHECVHLFQFLMEDIGEDTPGWEIEAYFIQRLWLSVMKFWDETRGAAK